MFEETNQTTEAITETEEFFDDMGEELFADTGDGEQEQAVSAPDTADAQAEQEVPAPRDADSKPGEAEPKYKVKYNGVEQELPLSALIENAQKGMNYDHVLSERDSLKQSKPMQLVEKLAKAMNMTTEDYVRWAETQEEEREIARQVAGGMPEEAARRLAVLEGKLALREREQEREKEEKEQRDRFAALLREYPEVKTLPKEVSDAISAGETPLNAYRAYENRELRQKLAALEKQKENAVKSTGSLKDSGNADDTDDFMAGFSK